MLKHLTDLVSRDLTRLFLRRFSPNYWIRRQRRHSLLFRSRKALFGIRSWFRSQRESIGTTRYMLATTSRQFALAAAVVAACEILANILSDNWSYLRAHFQGTRHLLFRVVEGIVADQATIMSFYTTVGSIEGTLLGLYLASVSIVVSTTYATVPGEVRALLLREKAGNKYVRTVALCASMALLLVALNGVGYKSAALTLGVIAGIAVVSIFSLVELGTRIFYFFDPAHLAGIVVQELAHNIRLATTWGFAWDDPSFQEHYRKQAEQHLTTYRHIALIAAEDHRHALVKLGGNISDLLTHYGKEKLSIPTTSRWYRRIYRHKSWLMTDHSEVSVAMQTGTVLHPEEVPDHNWFEADVAEVLVHIANSLIAKRNISEAASTAYGLAQALQGMSKRWAVEEVLRVYTKIKPVLIAGLLAEADAEAGKAGGKEDQIQDTLVLADALGMTLVGISLGFAENLREMDANSFGKDIADIDWHAPAAVYGNKMPRTVLKELEILSSKITFEKKIEGLRISPTWYVQQIAAVGLARYVSDATENLMKEMEDLFPITAEKLIDAARYLVAAQLAQRGMEAHNKLTTQLEETRSCVERLLVFRKVPDIPWPVPDFDAYNVRARAMHERMLVVWSKLVVPLSAVSPAERHVDYFGQAYTILAHECYIAMSSGNEDLFRKIFAPFFAAGILAYEKMFRETAGRSEEVVIALSTEPYMDLLELSGYSIIYSELDGKEYWETAKNVWDRYISKHPQKDTFIRFLATVNEARSTIRLTTPRETQRFSWKQTLDNTLRDRGLIDRLNSQRYRGRHAPEHLSPVIRALIEEGYFMEEQASQVFLAVYLRNRPEAAGQTFPRRTQEFSELIRDMQAKDREE